MESSASLQLSQHAGGAEGRHRIDVTANAPGLQALHASAELAFALSAQDEEEIRWYLEDFLEFDEEPAPSIAAGGERRMAEVGEALFRAIFQANDDCRAVWHAIHRRLVHLIEQPRDLLLQAAHLAHPQPLLGEKFTISYPRGMAKLDRDVLGPGWPGQQERGSRPMQNSGELVERGQGWQRLASEPCPQVCLGDVDTVRDDLEAEARLPDRPVEHRRCDRHLDTTSHGPSHTMPVRQAPTFGHSRDHAAEP